MKQIVFFVLLLLESTLSSFGQFSATKDGLVAKGGLTYYVAEIEGKTAQELFNSTKGYIMSNFRNPDAVSSQMENQMINLHVVLEKAFPCYKWLGIHAADVDLNFVMYFKDGKIRFDIPSLNMMRCYSISDPMGIKPYRDVVFSSGGTIKMFDKKGKVKNELAVNGLNTFINGIVNEICSYANKRGNNDNW